MKPADLIDQLVLASNAGDAGRFASLFTPDAVTYEHPGIPAQRGRAEIEAFYTERFRRSPSLRTEVRHRIDLGRRVVDHECVSTGEDGPSFDCVAIYEIQNDRIARLDIVRAEAVASP